FHASAPTEIYTLSLHDALPILEAVEAARGGDDDCQDGQRAHEVDEAAEAAEQDGEGGEAGRRLQRVEDGAGPAEQDGRQVEDPRSEEHTSELQSLAYLVCRLLL